MRDQVICGTDPLFVSYEHACLNDIDLPILLSNVSQIYHPLEKKKRDFNDSLIQTCIINAKYIGRYNSFIYLHIYKISKIIT
jgi:hypothetical protein